MQQTDQMSHRAEGLLTEQKMEKSKQEIGWKQSLSKLCFHFRDLSGSELCLKTLLPWLAEEGCFSLQMRNSSVSLISSKTPFSFPPDSLNHKLLPQVVAPNLFSFWLKNSICGSLIKGSDSGKEQEKLQFPYEPFDMKLNIKYHKGSMFAKETILKCSLYKSWRTCSYKSLMENSEPASEKFLSIFIILNYRKSRRDVFKICVLVSSYSNLLPQGYPVFLFCSCCL